MVCAALLPIVKLFLSRRNFEHSDCHQRSNLTGTCFAVVIPHELRLGVPFIREFVAFGQTGCCDTVAESETVKDAKPATFCIPVMNPLIIYSAAHGMNVCAEHLLNTKCNL